MRIVAPVEVDSSAVVVAITSALRGRGFRVGAIEVRSGLDGGLAIVLTTGAGARLTLPMTRDLEALRARAAAFDPGVDVLLVGPGEWPAGTPAIEVVAGDGTPSTAAVDLIATRTAGQLGGPGDDLGLAGAIEQLLGRRGGSSELARASEAPIESARRLLERPSVAREPERARRGWRRWLGL